MRLLALVSRTSTLLFSSSVRNSRCPSSSGVKWSKSPSFKPGSGMVATCLSGSLLCAKDKSGIDRVRVHTANILRLITLSPFECCSGTIIGRDKNHADATTHSRTRQRRPCRRLFPGTRFGPYFGHFKGFAPAPAHAAKHKLIFL